MSHKKPQYHIRGYRYAPESFRAYERLSSKEVKEIPLDSAQRHKLGTLHVTQGEKAAFDYVKQIDRARKRKCRLYMSYGFLTKEDYHTYLYSQQLYCREDAPVQKRLELFKQLKETLMQTQGVVLQGYECKLDEQYRPVDVKEMAKTADFSRPVIVWLRAA